MSIIGIVESFADGSHHVTLTNLERPGMARGVWINLRAGYPPRVRRIEMSPSAAPEPTVTETDEGGEAVITCDLDAALAWLTEDE